MIKVTVKWFQSKKPPEEKIPCQSQTRPSSTATTTSSEASDLSKLRDLTATNVAERAKNNAGGVRQKKNLSIMKVKNAESALPLLLLCHSPTWLPASTTQHNQRKEPAASEREAAPLLLLTVLLRLQHQANAKSTVSHDGGYQHKSRATAAIEHKRVDGGGRRRAASCRCVGNQKVVSACFVPFVR